MNIVHTLKFLSLILFFCASVAFCMDDPNEKADQFPADGHQWTLVKSEEEAQQFRDLVVLYKRSKAQHFVDSNDERLFKLYPSQPIFCGLVAKKLDLTNQIDQEILLKPCQRGKTRHHLSALIPPITFNPEKPILMRLLTCKEIAEFSRRNAELKKERKLFFSGGPFCSSLPAGCFTLRNLIKEERDLYVRKQVGKEAWEWHRLLLLGSQDKESLLHVLPKEIVRHIYRFRFNELLAERMQHLDLNQACMHYGLRTPDEGCAFELINSQEKTKKFLGKVVVFNAKKKNGNSDIVFSSFGLMIPKAIDELQDPIPTLSILNTGQADCTKRKGSPCYLTSSQLAQTSFQVRLLTLHEIRYLASQKLVYGGIFPLPDFVCKRLKTIGNLRHEERGPFIYDPKAVFTLRLIHKFRDSVLNPLPLDVLRIIKKIINAERAHEEDIQLDFELHEK